jgi:hypothetical protein
MAKLNYDRDVKTLLNQVQKLYSGEKLTIKNPTEKWVLYIGADEACNGTLREIFCYLQGMLRVLTD